ncbi:MAG: hypothetical protein HY876_07665 [Coriobacteriales bacterium]|nr:hypothetical protein [Coriobacteriales bacterium]
MTAKHPRDNGADTEVGSDVQRSVRTVRKVRKGGLRLRGLLRRSGTSERGPRSRIRKVPLRTRRRLIRAIAGIAALALVAIACAYGVTAATSTDRCVGCHATTPSANRHESVDCVSCHRPGGAMGWARQVLAYPRMAIAMYRTGEARSARADVVPSDGCARCHQALLTKDADSGRRVRLSHGHLRDLGVPCARCHDNVGHQVVQVAKARSAMRQCLTCHDGKSASAKCSLCHIGKPSDASPGARDVRSVPLPVDGTCRGCHTRSLATKCVECHGGVEMPHPAGWANGGHFYYGEFKQEGCKICHERESGVPPSPHGTGSANYGGGFCNKECHTFPSPHGDRTRWMPLHGAASRGKRVRQPVCDPCHGDAPPLSMCDYCHADSTCESCHREAKRRESAGPKAP